MIDRTAAQLIALAAWHDIPKVSDLPSNALSDPEDRDSWDRVVNALIEYIRVADRALWDHMFDAAQQAHKDGGRELARLVIQAYED